MGKHIQPDFYTITFRLKADKFAVTPTGVAKQAEYTCKTEAFDSADEVLESLSYWCDVPECEFVSILHTTEMDGRYSTVDATDALAEIEIDKTLRGEPYTDLGDYFVETWLPAWAQDRIREASDDRRSDSQRRELDDLTRGDEAWAGR